MITGINESKKLTKHTSCECKCRFDGRKCNSNQWLNKDKCLYVSIKTFMYVENTIFGIPLREVAKMGNI